VRKQRTAYATVSPQLQCAQIAIVNREAAARLHGALKVDR